MPDDTFVFLDFDDTLSDQFRFNTQYVRAIGALLAPTYGGDIEAWARSGIDMLETLEADYLAHFYRRPLAGYCAWLETIRTRSVELLFGGMGLPTPPNTRSLALETQFQALLACDATYQGAAETLRQLKEGGYRLQITSGQESEYLLGALRGAGLDTYVENRFGPDLIDCAKEGPEFYERIFATLGVRPADVIVVDDFPDAIGWALQTGTTVIQAMLSVERHFEAILGVAALLTDLADLPQQIQTLQSKRRS